MTLSGRCDSCGRPKGHGAARGLCNACYKRLIWRKENPGGAERDREASRRWKDGNRERNRARDRAYWRERRAVR